MALSKLFKKTSAPEELPDLAIDELKKDLKKDFSEKEESKTEEKKDETPKPKEEKTEEDNTKEETPESNGDETEEKKEETPSETDNSKNDGKTNEEKVNLEKSFFNPLVTELKKENFDPSKINSWYEKRFSQKGAIEEMKEYWEKQKDEFITEAVEKEFRSRINEKMNALQKLEAEWQEIYIDLIKKEEEMKKEEKNIKKTIKEFSDVFNKKGNLKKEPKAK